MNDDRVVRLDRDDLEKARDLSMQEAESRAVAHLEPRAWIRARWNSIEFHEQLVSKYDLHGVGFWWVNLITGEIIFDVNKRSLHRADPEE